MNIAYKSNEKNECVTQCPYNHSLSYGIPNVGSYACAECPYFIKHHDDYVECCYELNNPTPNSHLLPILPDFR